MNNRKFKIRYLLIIWLVIYILTSLFKFIKIKNLIYERYGVVSKSFSTKMYMNESIIIDGALLIIGFPILLLSGGWNFTKWAYSDVKFDFSQKLTTYIELKPKFMQEKFSVTMRGGQIVSDTFFETLSNDPKFQHLYSEWIKKQVGIDDGNVKFEFTGVYDKPYIEFDKITTLSDDYREIFENTHNLYCNRCYISNIDNLNDMTAKVIANEIREKYLYKAVEITNIPTEKISGNIHLSTGTFKNTDKNLKFRFDLHDIISELIIQN